MLSLIFCTFFLESCAVSYLLDPSKIRIITSRARSYKNSKVYKASLNNNVVSIKKGDTVYGIARSNNVPVRTLIEYNKLTPPYTLKVGQKLKLPPAPFHIVQKGDTLYSISRRYNVELASLARTNKIKSPYNIYEGQKLILPGSIETAEADKTPKAVNTSSNSTNQKTTKTAKKRKTNKTNIPTPDARSSSKFAWPVKGKIITKYGPMGKGRHNDGINIAASKGSSVLAAENGVVAYSGSQLKGFGNLLLLKHANGYMTAYAHNDSILVKRGDKIKKGDKIATVGATGNVSSPQLHFEIRKGTKALDPAQYLEP
ncbi:MAG: peptidoglycan DD-metalloendopeptidase family protein [Alphaproteobacteria bacterium]